MNKQTCTEHESVVIAQAFANTLSAKCWFT